MQKAIIGKKVGMTQIFDETGKVIPVTVIEAGPCTVVQKKTADKEGFDSIQLGFSDIAEKKLSKPEAGHLKKAGVELRKDVKDFSPEALQLICQYAWPGNLRQMRNIVRRAVLLSEDSIISPLQLSEELKENSRGDTGLPPHPVPLRDKESERERIVQTLAQTGNNKSLAARLLGIDRKTLYNKMKSYGLDQDS